MYGTGDALNNVGVPPAGPEMWPKEAAPGALSKSASALTRKGPILHNCQSRHFTTRRAPTPCTTLYDASYDTVRRVVQCRTMPYDLYIYIYIYVYI